MPDTQNYWPPSKSHCILTKYAPPWACHTEHCSQFVTSLCCQDLCEQLEHVSPMSLLRHQALTARSISQFCLFPVSSPVKFDLNYSGRAMNPQQSGHDMGGWLLAGDYQWSALDLDLLSSEHEEPNFVAWKRHIARPIYLLRHFLSEWSILWKGLLFCFLRAGLFLNRLLPHDPHPWWGWLDSTGVSGSQRKRLGFMVMNTCGKIPS